MPFHRGTSMQCLLFHAPAVVVVPPIWPAANDEIPTFLGRNLARSYAAPTSRVK